VDQPFVKPPDYCGDLNKMNKAERLFGGLDDDKYLEYVEYPSLSGFGIRGYSRISASARLRAEAFVLTSEAI
jgi:hypothetical protein